MQGVGKERAARTTGTAFRILAAISVCHLVNDTLQSLITAIYPILKQAYRLDFSQIGLITLTYQLTASILQPLVGWYTDRKPQPYSLPAGMTCTLAGLLILSRAPNFLVVLASVAVVGAGSAVFHPESSRVARMASGGRHGLAQSLFQVGGNAGASIGPLLAAFIVLPAGQPSIAWFSSAALAGILILSRVSVWYSGERRILLKSAAGSAGPRRSLSTRRLLGATAVLVALVFSKYFYLASLTSYYTFYLMSKFHLPVRDAQIHLFGEFRDFSGLTPPAEGMRQ